eukprot:s165_g5.t1
MERCCCDSEESKVMTCRIHRGSDVNFSHHSSRIKGTRRFHLSSQKLMWSSKPGKPVHKNSRIHCTDLAIWPCLRVGAKNG